MSKDRPSNPSIQQRSRIATTAARLLAENGLQDYSLAKRKALQELNLPASTPLPENAEVEAELRTYQRVFQADEHTDRLYDLRRKAVEIMSIIGDFRPYLAGPVLDGTAGRYAEIDIQLFPDSAKDVEIFLLNRGIDFEHDTPRSERAEAVLTVYRDETAIHLVIYPYHAERIVAKTRDGRPRPRARLDEVRRLLDTATASSASA